MCAPASGNPVLLWLNVAFSQVEVLWHCIASLGKVRRDMVRIRRALVILQVAGHARRTVQVVVVVDVAIRALARRHRVDAGQSETCGGVIELAVGPDHGVVTLLARRGESGMRHWRGGVVVVVLVATDARRVGDVVVVVDVAIGALARRDSMRSGQWKCRLRMVEAGRLPRRCGVTRTRRSAQTRRRRDSDCSCSDNPSGGTYTQVVVVRL